MSHDNSDDKKPGQSPSGVSAAKLQFTRRGILGAGALGVAGTVLPSPLLRSARADRDDDDDDRGRRGRRGRLLLKNGTVLTLIPGWTPLSDTDVLIENGKIKEVRPNINAHGAKVVDCRGMIVMPGFVDSHRHMWQGLIRNIGPDDLLIDYVIKVLFGFALKLTPEQVYIGDLVSALSALNSGITTILDWSHIANTTQHTDAAIAGLRASGIRGVYAYGPSFGHASPWYADAAGTNPYPEDFARLATTVFSSDDQLLTLALAAAGPEFIGLPDPIPSAVLEWNTARQFDKRISVHVGVGQGGKNGLLLLLDAALKAQPGGRGLDDDTTYIHACTLSDDELNLIVATGGTFSLAVPIEMQMGHGTPPVARLFNDRKTRFSLSVDVETNMPTDMFTQMRACFALQREIKNQEHLFVFDFADPLLAEQHAKLLNVRDVLELATVEGAKANGLASKVGMLKPGMEADVILLRANQLNISPLNDDAGAIVLGMDTSNVDSVFVAGRAMKRNGRLVGVDLDRILRRAERAQEELLTS